MASESKLEKQVEAALKQIEEARVEYAKCVVGQSAMLEKMLIALVTGGHVLLEGVPGLAKTKAVSTLAKMAGLNFSRIQFTPDLLPADILGTQIYNQKTGTFQTKTGPLFANLVLADEINRAPSKVQSALLEAMQERQITLGDRTWPLEEPFMVLATQNPIEQEGTYPLPEAQVDRFMMKVLVEYPSRKEELEIVRMNTAEEEKPVKKVISTADVISMRETAAAIYMDEKLIQYIVNLVYSTREPEKAGLDKSLLRYGASPRASIYLAKAARAYAMLQGDAYVKTEDIKAVAMDVLRHRITVSYEAEAEGVSAQDVLVKIFENVETP